MRKILFALILIVINRTITSAQDIPKGIEMPYAYSEISIKINGWDLKRLDYTPQTFESLIDIPVSSRNNSGQDTIDEFGYDMITYDFGGNEVVVRGDGGEPLSTFVCYFTIVNPKLKINDIAVGDKISKVYNTFKKYYLEDDIITINYGDNTLSFCSGDGKIVKIVYQAPL